MISGSSEHHKNLLDVRNVKNSVFPKHFYCSKEPINWDFPITFIVISLLEKKKSLFELLYSSHT
jgi:hypothetical protein